MFGFEIEILQFFESIRTEGLTRLVELVTMFGEETLMIILVAALWFAVDKMMAQRIAFVAVMSLSANGILKNLLKVPRPFASGKVTCARPETATGYSFPSGHVQNFTTWSSLVAIQIRKRWFYMLVSLLILGVGFSRMYLGAHYPSDVLVGILLGVSFAVFGNLLFDRVENKRKLYLTTSLILTPFVLFFLCCPDPLFEDFFKFYGMLFGLFVVVGFEGKFVQMTYDIPLWKKLIRVVGAVILAYALKEGVAALFATSVVWLSLLADAARYFALVFVVFGLYPWVLKRCNL